MTNVSQQHSFHRILKLIELGLVCLAWIFVISLIAWLTFQVSTHHIPFDTDEADHANPALEMFTWIQRGDLAHSLSAITRQAFYPPLYSFAITSSYLIAGVGIVQSRLPTVLILAFYLWLLIASIQRLVRQIDYSGASFHFALLTPAIVLCFAATSTITILNAVLCMLELPGMLGATILIYVLAKRPASHRLTVTEILILGFLSAAVFLTKYNFGIIIIPAILWSIFTTPPFTGEFKRNFRSALLLAIVIAFIFGLWVLLTDRSVMYNFFVGHKSYAPRWSEENIFFELKSWYSSYCINPATAVLVLVFAALGSVRLWRYDAVRFAAWNVIWAFLILFISTTNEERHFIIAAPALFFLAGAGIHTLFLDVQRRASRQGVLPFLLAFALLSPVVAKLPEWCHWLEQRVPQQFEGKPEFFDLFEHIAADVDPSKPILVNGVSDDFGIEALRWMIAQRGKIAYTEVLVETFHFRDDKARTAKGRNRNLDAPYRIDGFPKKPMHAVLDQNYYHYGVKIKNLEKEQRFKKEAQDFEQTLSPYEIASYSLAGRNISIYRLPPASSEPHTRLQ